MKRKLAPQVIVVFGALLGTGTTAKATPDSIIVRRLTVDSQTTGSNRQADTVDPTSVRSTIAELRRLSGLTWEQLAGALGVTRRTVHFWANGRPINLRNERHLHALLQAIRQADRGMARANREMLLAADEGTCPLDLLAAHEYSDFLQQVGEGKGRRKLAREPLSPAAQSNRGPLPPEQLIDALQGRVHNDPGPSRAVKRRRGRRRGRS